MDPLAAATDLRAAAADAYERRAACLDALAAQIDAGLWQSEAVRAAVAQGRRDRALLRMRAWDFIEAAGGGQDLSLEYAPLLQPGRPPTAADLDAAGAFLDKLRPRPEDTERWLAALKLEAQAYLAQLRGDRLLRGAEQHADRHVRRVLLGADRLPPDDLRRMRAYVTALRVYRGLALPWRIEPLYRRFLAKFPTPQPVADLIARLEADFDAVPRELFEAWGYLADAVVPALEMRNPADRAELDALIRVQTPLEAVMDGRPEGDVVAVEGVTQAEFRRSGRSLRAVIRAVPEDSRAAAVLKAWQGLAYLGLGDMRGLFALLEGVAADDEALGIVIRALRGEARYRLGQYEDAYLDLLRAERTAQQVAQASACANQVAQASACANQVAQASAGANQVAQASACGNQVAQASACANQVAQASACANQVAQASACANQVAQASACGERTAQAKACATSPSPAERDALSRLAQKAGNALLAIGDEAKADEAFSRARAYLPDDPRARATDLINRGNLLLLRNALDREQGYMAVDRVLQKRLVEEGPAALDAERLRRHAESLDAAAAAYRDALEILGDGAPYLAALCHLNLGNVAWARWKTQPDRSHLLAAQQAYECALALLTRRGEQRGLRATARVNLSEVRILLGEPERALKDLTGAPLRGGGNPSGLATTHARSHPDLTGFPNPSGLASTHPDLPWQVQFNLARIYQALGEMIEADAAYRAALDLIDAQRAGVRSDAWQASFLRDKTEVYEGYLGFLYETGGPEKVSAMFDVIERLRAHAFLDLLHRAQVDVALPAALRAEADALLGKIAAANEALRAATLADDEATATRLSRKQTEHARQWADLQAQLLASQQADAQLNPPRITLEETQARLRPDGFRLSPSDAPVRSGGDENSIAPRPDGFPKPVRSDNDENLIAPRPDGFRKPVRSDDDENSIAPRPDGFRKPVRSDDDENSIAPRPDGFSKPVRSGGDENSIAPRPDGFRKPVRSDDQIMLIYQLGEAASYLLVITADTATVHRLPPRRRLELLALPVIFDCTFGDANAAPRFLRNNLALSRALLPDDVTQVAELAVPLRGKRLLIAPDAALHYLPFEVLFPDPDALPATIGAYADLAPHYLLAQADVTYIPSASAWRELSDRPRSDPASSLLAVYDVRYDTGDPPLWAMPILMKLDRVPGAKDVRKAVEFCRQAWPDLPVAQLRARRDDDSAEDADHQPTEANFLRVAPVAAARYVVFNGHATYNDKHPSLSGLIFNLSKPADPDAADVPADNFLRVDELFRLELPAAELTLLAACQTALGAPYRGEGLNALLRAFMYRGSPAVVATLWAVDAAAASWLVRRFFKLLAEQPDADPARLFNQAKRAAITFDRQWQPFHWAPFIYAGGAQRRGEL